MTVTLTLRQTQILALVAEGLTNAQIGVRMRLSHGTVTRELKLLYRAIDANDRAHAVYLALRAGVLR
jgi:DNA-binding NarL/FixJ family response regulator